MASLVNLDQVSHIIRLTYVLNTLIRHYRFILRALQHKQVIFDNVLHKRSLTISLFISVQAPLRPLQAELGSFHNNNMAAFCRGRHRWKRSHCWDVLTRNLTGETLFIVWQLYPHNQRSQARLTAGILVTEHRREDGYSSWNRPVLHVWLIIWRK